jgi:hypothetical protein
VCVCVCVCVCMCGAHPCSVKFLVARVHSAHDSSTVVSCDENAFPFSSSYT